MRPELRFARLLSDMMKKEEEEEWTMKIL